jgi:hypothetical protein
MWGEIITLAASVLLLVCAIVDRRSMQRLYNAILQQTEHKP